MDHRQLVPSKFNKINHLAWFLPGVAKPAVLSSSSIMAPDPSPRTLTPRQEQVALALAGGATITGAAEQFSVNRTTIYRWLKTVPAFADAVQRGRAEFILARRDDLHYLSSRAMETLVAILDNPRSSPAVLLRAAMFILKRPQTPGQGWLLPELIPQPDGATINDSATIEAESARLADIGDLAPDPPDAAERNTMQHVTETEADPAESCEVPYSLGILPSCPVPLAVIERRNFRMHFPDTMDDLKTTPISPAARPLTALS